MVLMQEINQCLWMSIWSAKARARKESRKAMGNAKTKERMIRRANLLARKVESPAKAMEPSSNSNNLVQSKPLGRTTHGIHCRVVMERIANLGNLEKEEIYGKGKDGACHRCGGYGHYAKQCTVRVVGQEDGSQSNIEPKTGDNDKGNSGNAAVRRVSFSPSPSPSPSSYRLDFDISDVGGCSDSHDLHVNMISMVGFRSSETLEDVCSFSMW